MVWNIPSNISQNEQPDETGYQGGFGSQISKGTLLYKCTLIPPEPHLYLQITAYLQKIFIVNQM